MLLLYYLPYPTSFCRVWLPDLLHAVEEAAPRYFLRPPKAPEGRLAARKRWGYGVLQLHPCFAASLRLCMVSEECNSVSEIPIRPESQGA